MLYIVKQIKNSFMLSIVSSFSEKPGQSYDQANQNNDAWVIKPVEYLNDKQEITTKTKEENEKLYWDINEISQIDTSKFTRKIWPKEKWEDVIELNKFLILSTNLFKKEELSEDWLDLFSTKTLIMLKDYLLKKWYKWKVELAWETSFNYIKNDVELSKKSSEVQKPQSIEEIIEKNELFNSNQKIIANFNLKLDIKDKEKVLELQKALIAEWKTLFWWADWIFWDSTLNNLLEAQNENSKKVKQSQIVWETPAIEKETIKHSAYELVLKQIEKTRGSVKDLDNKLMVTDELNWLISKYLFRQNAWYSIEELIRQISWNNKYAEILKIQEEYDMMLKSDNWKEKLERATKYLTNYIERESWESWVWEDSIWENVFDHTKKAFPWLIGIYLWDIPLSFLKDITPWVNINKSVAFKNWITEWMKEEFSDYYKKNESKTNLLWEQYDLRSILTSLDLKDNEKNDVLAWKIDSLSSETLVLLKTYMNVRLIPDLKILHEQSYNLAEKWHWITLKWFFGLFTDEKYKKWNEIINEIEEMVSNWKTPSQIDDKVWELLNLLDEEWDVKGSIDYTKNRRLYMNEVEKQNDVFNSITDLLNAWYQELKFVYYFENFDDLKQFWATKSDQKSLDTLKSILDKKPISKKELDSFIKNNPSTMNYINSLWNKEKMTNYLLSNIPLSDKLIHTKEDIAKHGKSLLWLSNEEALKQATTTTPEKWWKVSQLWLAYQTIINKWEITWISYSDFENAFKNKTDVAIDSITDEPIINTWRRNTSDDLSSFADLSRWRWDKIAFKLSPIEKTYTFYSNWKEIKQKVTYNLYMRPDCWNPLLVPASIQSIKGESLTEFDPRTITTVDGKLPIVIPWFLLNKMFWGTSKTTSWDWGFSTTPWADWIGWTTGWEVTWWTWSSTIWTIGWFIPN